MNKVQKTFMPFDSKLQETLKKNGAIIAEIENGGVFLITLDYQLRLALTSGQMTNKTVMIESNANSGTFAFENRTTVKIDPRTLKFEDLNQYKEAVWFECCGKIYGIPMNETDRYIPAKRVQFGVYL
jgi:hypothetical protein